MICTHEGQPQAWLSLVAHCPSGWCLQPRWALYSLIHCVGFLVLLYWYLQVLLICCSMVFMTFFILNTIFFVGLKSYGSASAFYGTSFGHNMASDVLGLIIFEQRGRIYIQAICLVYITKKRLQCLLCLGVTLKVNFRNLLAGLQKYARIIMMHFA